MTRVLIADDQALVRGGLRIILERQPDIEVCGEAATGVEAVAVARDTQPDLVLMDIQMPKLDGLDAMRATIRADPRVRVLILTTYDLDEYVVTALREGASGYVLKDVDPAELIRCVRAVAAGETVLAQPVVRRLVATYLKATAGPRTGRAVPTEIDRLTGREQEVLRELARGSTNAEIAAALYLSPATVKSHVASILGKLGLRDRLQAVILAYESGFIRPGEDQDRAGRA